MFIIIMGCSSEKPFWAMRFGSIPSTLKVFLVFEGDVLGEFAFEDGEVVVGKRYFKFFCRKTGYNASINMHVYGCGDQGRYLTII
jgi:hypothetical protein